jgi:hypothetical protein
MIIKVDTINAQRQLIKGFSELSKKKVDLSITRAINSALGKTQTAAIRAVTGRYNLTREEVAKKFFVVKASPASITSMMRGYLKAYNQPFTLAAFNPKEINQGMATITKGGRVTGGRKAIGLRANKKLIKSGVIVEVIRGQQKVLKSAFIALRNKNSAGGFSVSARGKYNRGFQFNNDDANRSLRGIGVASALRTNELNKPLKEYAENEYLRILYKELEKRVKGVGEQHSKYV